jgi:MFS transporter, OFA family, oxalate/formate antiporter
VPITVCIQWFPRHKGLVAGIAVAGFGGGAALVSTLGGRLMQSGMATPFGTFGYLGIGFLILASCAGSFLQSPPDVAQQKLARLKLADVLRHRAFGIMYLAMFTALAAGFTVNANLKEFHAGQAAAVGVLAVSLFAIANALGRLAWGFLFDRVRAASALQMNLAAQALVLMLAFWALHSPTGLLTFAFLAGFNYGGVLVLYVSSVSRIWTKERVGEVYGLLFSANIAAAISPVLAGATYDALGNFNAAICVLSLLMAGAALLVRKHAAVINREGP